MSDYKISININTDNAAFDGDEGYEIWNILAEWAGTLAHKGLKAGTARIKDTNGNKVGEVVVEKG